VSRIWWRIAKPAGRQSTKAELCVRDLRHASGSEHHASLTALVSSCLFAAMAMVARLVSQHIPGPEVAFVRFAAGIATVLVAVAVLRVDLRPQRWGWLISRGVFGGSAVLLYFACIAKIGVGMATSSTIQRRFGRRCSPGSSCDQLRARGNLPGLVQARRR